MILNLTKPQYRSLMELLSLSATKLEKMEDYGMLDSEQMDHYDRLLQSIFRHAKKMGCEDMVEYYADEKRWEVRDELIENGEQIFESLKEESLEERSVDNSNFIQNLASFMAFREQDLYQSTSEQAIDPQTLNEEKMMEMMTDVTNNIMDYQAKLLEGGLGLLEWVDKKTLQKRYPDLDVEAFLDNQAQIMTQGFDTNLTFDEDDFEDLFESVDAFGDEFDVNDLFDMEPPKQPALKNPKISTNPKNKVVPLVSKSKQLSFEQMAIDEPLVYQLKISLNDSRPPIWRRVLVTSDMTLSQVHQLIQILFGFDDAHLHGFRQNRQSIDEHQEPHLMIQQLLTKAKQKLDYEYDFGDSWTFTLLLEAIETDRALLENQAAKVIKGKRGDLYEDIGGVWAINDIVDAIKNNHPLPPHLSDWDISLETLENCDIEGYNKIIHKQF